MIIIEKKIYKVNNIIYIEYYSYHVVTVIQRCHNPVRVTKEKYDLHKASFYILYLPIFRVDVSNDCFNMLHSFSQSVNEFRHYIFFLKKCFKYLIILGTQFFL